MKDESESMKLLGSKVLDALQRYFPLFSCRVSVTVVVSSGRFTVPSTAGVTAVSFSNINISTNGSMASVEQVN